MSETINTDYLPPLPDNYKWFSTDTQFGIEIHLAGHTFAAAILYTKDARTVEVYRANAATAWMPLAENLSADEAAALMYQHALLGMLE